MPIIVHDNSLQNFPSGYQLWQSLSRDGHLAQNAGFAVGNDEVFRFCNRYKVARAFRGIALEGYKATTVDGYSGLFRVMLMWSAFERFLKVVGQEQKTCQTLLVVHEPRKFVDAVRNADTGARLFSFVRERTDNKTTKEQLDFFLGDLEFNPTYLASALRHIFAHGWLTPHAGGTDPEAVSRVCGFVFDFHMNVIDREFSRLVAEYAAKVRQ